MFQHFKCFVFKDRLLLNHIRTFGLDAMEGNKKQPAITIELQMVGKIILA